MKIKDRAFGTNFVFLFVSSPQILNTSVLIYKMLDANI